MPTYDNIIAVQISDGTRLNGGLCPRVFLIVMHIYSTPLFFIGGSVTTSVGSVQSSFGSFGGLVTTLVGSVQSSLGSFGGSMTTSVCGKVTTSVGFSTTLSSLGSSGGSVTTSVGTILSSLGSSGDSVMISVGCVTKLSSLAAASSYFFRYLLRRLNLDPICSYLK